MRVMVGAGKLTQEAIDAFIGQIWLMNDVGFTPPHVLADQIASLGELIGVPVGRHALIDGYLAGPFRHAKPFIELMAEQRPTGDEDAASDWDGEGSALTIEDASEVDASGPLALITNAQLPLRDQWKFHPYDIDPFPSMPHGHLHGSARPAEKLDPYRNRITSSGKKGPRYPSERRIGIRALWNDPEFRRMARENVLFQIDADHLRFQRIMKKRGVRHPLRLPR